MPPTPWLVYIGAVTGIVGMLTGVVGATLGVISYRRVSKMKALDLRLELRKLAVDIWQALDALAGLLERANQSRFAVSAATGQLLTGAMDAWKQQVPADRLVVAQLRAEFEASTGDYQALTEKDLETRLVEFHGLLARVQRLTENYRHEIAVDDKEREHIREDIRTRFR